MTISPAILMMTRDCFKVLHQSTLLFIYKPVHRECLRWIQSLCPCWQYPWVSVLWCESTERIEGAVSLRTCWLCVTNCSQHALSNCSEHALIVHGKKRSFLVRAEEVVVQYNKFEVRRWDGKIALIFCHFAFAFEVCRVDSTLLPADMLLSLNFQVKTCLTGTGQQMMRQCVAKLSLRMCFPFSF